MESSIIYKKDSNNNIRYLLVEAVNGQLITTSGILGSENPVIQIKNCQPKNIGKKNETSSEEQAVAEMHALLIKKLDKDYSNTIEEAKEDLVILPMLANEYSKHSKKIKWGVDKVFVQPKLDGMRCLKQGSELISRQNKEITTMNHISSQLPHIADIIDGELYLHGEGFQTNMQYIKKYRKGLSERISFHVYDLVLPDLNFEDRYLLLKSILDQEISNHIKLVDTYEIKSEEELKKYHDMFISEGYEGTMVRISKSGYKISGRSSELLKYKDFDDQDIIVKDIIPCKNETDWGEVIFDWPGAKGHRAGDNILGSSTRMSHEQRKEILLNKKNYIGKKAELRFFGLSDTGVPRFPVVVGFRLDK